MAQNNPANLTRNAWRVTFNSVDLGYSDGVRPDLALMLDPIKVGTIGKATLGLRFVGLERDLITFNLREINSTIIAALTPWPNLTSSAVISPPINTDLYGYAALLTLAPTSPADLSSPDHTQDLNLIKAVPISVPNAFERKGTEDDVWPVTFRIFPDRALLPALVYGYVGATAPSGD